MKNKIGWCDMTWNPVIGCLNHCEYCYARGIAKRFWKKMSDIEIKHIMIMNNNNIFDINNNYYSAVEDNIKDFKPIILCSQFDKKFPKKPQRIFVGSMSEIYYWKPEWMERVLEKIRQYPQHTFQFLTKFPEIYSNWYFPINWWLGITINKDTDLWKDGFYYKKYYSLNNIKFLSIEPILEQITLLNLAFNWIIIGAETGNRRGKVIPKREWIEDIVDYCRNNNIPVYLKDSLKEIYPVEIKEFPVEV